MRGVSGDQGRLAEISNVVTAEVLVTTVYNDAGPL